MSSRTTFASLLTACLLAVGFLGLASASDAASAGQAVKKSRETARNYVLETKRRRRGPQIPQPRGPAYIYYDYPYYYSRGHYPTHIVRYVYYPSISYSRSSYPRYGGRCSDRHRGCVRQRGACKC